MNDPTFLTTTASSSTWKDTPVNEALPKKSLVQFSSDSFENILLEILQIEEDNLMQRKERNYSLLYQDRDYLDKNNMRKVEGYQDYIPSCIATMSVICIVAAPVLAPGFSQVCKGVGQGFDKTYEIYNRNRVEAAMLRLNHLGEQTNKSENKQRESIQEIEQLSSRVDSKKDAARQSIQQIAQSLSSR